MALQASKASRKSSSSSAIHGFQGLNKDLAKKLHGPVRAILGS